MEEIVLEINKENKKIKKLNKKIAVQVHAFYIDLFQEVIDNLEKIPYEYDLFVSTNTQEKKRKIEKLLKDNNYSKKYKIEIFENKGRDIYPYIFQLKKKIRNYDYVLHLHTKKSKYSDFGDNWRKYLYYNLLGTTENIESIFYMLEHNSKLGIVYPQTYEKIVDKMDVGSNQPLIDELKDRIGINTQFEKIFPSGSMFWAKVNSILPIFDVVNDSDFSEELDQTDGTIAHAIERIFCMLASSRGYYCRQIVNNTLDYDVFNDVNSYKADKFTYKLQLSKMSKELEQAKAEKDIYIKQANLMREELDKILSSKSWKITGGLRKLTEIKNKISLRTKNNKSANIQPTDITDANILAYQSEYQDNKDFSKYKTDIKTIAYYLPQYHTFPENDKWWGKGFTEWTNTSKAYPHFDGHYQPRIPHQDIGYYNLDNIDTIKKQVSLAKQHGIYGFAFYYYWFSGKRLMEKPIDLFLESDIDFPFCLYWANENWTRTWDGLQNNVLIKQDYKEEDCKKFIDDIKKYIDDRRYIKIDGKPVIMVYNPKQIPDFRHTVIKWRECARKNGIGEIYVIATTTIVDPVESYIDVVDAENDFAPHGFGNVDNSIFGINDTKKVFNYQKMVDESLIKYKKHITPKPFYYSCTMGWDNAARRSKDYAIYYGFNLKSYYKWIRMIIDETRRRFDKDNRIIFVNAWNEWAEGTYLEPDEKYGYANINTLSKAIFDLPLEDEN